MKPSNSILKHHTNKLRYQGASTIHQKRNTWSKPKNKIKLKKKKIIQNFLSIFFPHMFSFKLGVVSTLQHGMKIFNERIFCQMYSEFRLSYVPTAIFIFIKWWFFFILIWFYKHEMISFVHFVVNRRVLIFCFCLVVNISVWNFVFFSVKFDQIS